MANRNRDSRDPRDDRGNAPSRRSDNWVADLIRVATLVGVGLLVAMNAKMITDTGSFKESVSQLNERIDGVNNRIVALGTEMRKAAAPQRAGPDPNKVYPVKLEGAPTEGPASAPIVIAEFSDFQ
jgi:hypothetical protein